MNPPTTTDRHALTREIDELLIHVRGLVLVHEILVARGATKAVLEAHTQEVERKRGHLAELIADRVEAFGMQALAVAA